MRYWGEVTPGATVTKCGMWGDSLDVITFAILGDCRFRGRCGCGKRSNFAFSHWLEVSPLQHCFRDTVYRSEPVILRNVYATNCVLIVVHLSVKKKEFKFVHRENGFRQTEIVRLMVIQCYSRGCDYVTSFTWCQIEFHDDACIELAANAFCSSDVSTADIWKAINDRLVFKRFTLL